mmetsp:Transcript_20042/g.41923  ORF Transcript_20042/g.41923 Transcript_20042/m.41923 type:complete len:93 (+) Transcript_20042:2313-2591(+)
MQTVLMDAYESHDSSVTRNNKRFLWTLQRERRPPRQGFWLIHEVVYTKNSRELTTGRTGNDKNDQNQGNLSLEKDYFSPNFESASSVAWSTE